MRDGSILRMKPSGFLRCGAAAFALFAIAATAPCAAAFQSDAGPGDLAAERRKAIEYLRQGQPFEALPLVEHLVAANPDDAVMQVLLAECLVIKSRLRASADEVPALRKRALEAAERARKLGDNSVMLQEVLRILNDPGTASTHYSENADVNAKMQEGEQAFARGDNQGALAAYAAALKMDPKLYTAALFAGDVCFRTKDLPCASEWFAKAVNIEPNTETAYRYWGDALMAGGKMKEARERFIEAVIAQPSPKAWAGLKNWAQKNSCKLSPPRIDRPPISDDVGTVIVNPTDLDEKAGRSAWLAYSLTRAAWRQALFAKEYPNETQYRHSLAEESAALEAVAGTVDRAKATPLDAQLATLLELHRNGLLPAWIIFNAADAGIARDYADYRVTHRAELRTYLDKYIICAAPAANPPN